MPLTIPAQGLAEGEVMGALDDFRRADADWARGRTFSLVYYAGEAHQKLLERAHAMYAATNALNPMAFNSLRRMEAEVVRMTASMLHGGRDVVGTMTSGGTESILLAVKAARDRARALHGKKDTRRLNVVAPETVHVAFDKAAHYFGLELRFGRLRADLRADVDDMARLIDDDTALVVASAPQYPHGVVDPIEDVAALALSRGIPMHVDACIGGFVLPWVEKLGWAVPRWDFRVPGVTSISADIHKYGFGPKGASTVLYRDASYLRHQFFVSTDWPGGIYASPTIAGTRSGGAIAASWAAMVAMGEEGYLEHTRRAMQAAQALQRGLADVPELEVLGRPDATIVTWTTRKDSGVDVYAVADQLTARGWSVDRQQKPPCVHCTVTSNNLPVVDAYLADVRAAVAHVKAHPELRASGASAMYGMMAKVPARGMVAQGVLEAMEQLYGPDAANPDLDPVGGAGSGEDGAVAKLVRRFGGVALGVLDRVESVRDALSLKRGRRKPMR